MTDDNLMEAQNERLREELARQTKLTDAYKAGVQLAAIRFQARIDMLENALEAGLAYQPENVELRAVLDRVQALCVQLPPNMPDPIEAAMAHSAGWNAAMDTVQRALTVTGTRPPPHWYLSTGCLHDEHGYCQSHTGLSGSKTPAVCKFCKAPCQCTCHRATPAEESQ